jgi:hypothetical protein
VSARAGRGLRIRGPPRAPDRPPCRYIGVRASPSDLVGDGDLDASGNFGVPAFRGTQKPPPNLARLRTWC